MQSANVESYLITAVQTASPQQLHLLMIEAALKQLQRAEMHLQAQQADEAATAIFKCEDIVAEMLRGLKMEEAPELVRRVSAEYQFVFRSLVQAQAQQDSAKLAEARRVLTVHRDTWQQVCAQLAEQPQAAPRPHLPVAYIQPTAPTMLESFTVQA